MKKQFLLMLGAASLVLFMTACKPDPKASEEYKALKAELDKMKAADSVETANIELYNKLAQINDTTELDQLDQYLAADMNFHDMPEGMPNGLAGFKELMKGYFTAIPGMEMNVVHVAAKGDLVIAHVNLKGTNTGPMGPGMPATGKSVDVYGFDCIRLEGGKVVEYWSVTNEMKMMQQLGLMPAEGSM